MTGMFYGALTFNQPLLEWDTSKVVDMGQMFEKASVFNQSLVAWDTSNVMNMTQMFCGAKSFDQAIKDWNFQKVVSYAGMLFNAQSFDHDLPHGFDPEVGYQMPDDYSGEDFEEEGGHHGTRTETLDWSVLKGLLDDSKHSFL